jgi:hypothetical protein
LFQQLLFAIHQRIDVVRRQLKSVPVRDRIGRASFYTVATENTARIIDIVDFRVTLACRNAIRVRILSRFDVDTICRASRGAQKAADALLQSIFIAMQNVNAAVARLEVNGLVRIVLGDRLPKHIFERDTEALRQRCECLGNFADDRGHRTTV